MTIYVETRIRGQLEDLWQRTQNPECHERWDLRFTSIDYLLQPDKSEPQQFLYSTRIGCGIAVHGKGNPLRIAPNRLAAGHRRSVFGPTIPSP